MEGPKEIWAALAGEFWSTIFLVGISSGDFPEILPAGNGDFSGQEDIGFFRR
jgi:hypothetical protein